jgi:hypothetical protein
MAKFCPIWSPWCLKMFVIILSAIMQVFIFWGVAMLIANMLSAFGLIAILLVVFTPSVFILVAIKLFTFVSVFRLVV